MDSKFFKDKLLHYLQTQKKIVTIDNQQNLSNFHNKKIAIVFCRGCDSSTAGGQRALMNAKLLSKCGFYVFVSCFTPLESGTMIDDNIEIVAWKKKKESNPLARFLSYSRSGVINESISYVLSKADRIDLVEVYSVLSKSQMKKIKKEQSIYNYQLIFDVVEFQNFTEQNFASFFSYYVPNLYINKKAIKKNDKVVCISTYLLDYFKNKECQTLLIPFLNDDKTINRIKKPSFCEDKRVFLYAGSPGKKDDLISIIRGFLLLPSTLKDKTIFIIAGISKGKVLSLGLSKKELKDCESFVIFLGRIPFDSIKVLYSFVDFVVLMKNANMRHAKADFPSKISQALSFGVPVITTFTSDLHLYLRDGVDSVMVKDNCPSTFCDAIIKSFSFSDDYLKNMNVSASITASKSFSLGGYLNLMEEFISL